MTDWHTETADYWTDKSVMVTGGAGFLGSHLVEELRRRGEGVEIFVPRSFEYDLRERTNIRRAFSDSEPEIVIHLAATVGGIGANLDNPGRYFYENAVMGVELIELARQFGVEKLTVLGTICSYPEVTSIPFIEENLFDGYPEETNAPYGIAKKALLTQLKAYRKQYDLTGIYLMPVNLYGPRDDFDLETSHVIPAIIRKAVEARERGAESITAWGTGEPTREFLYVKDAADGILTATERHDIPEPINLGSGFEISISELIELITDLVGFSGEVEWDRSKPDGQPRRKLDTSRAQLRFGWEATTDFEDGLKRTIEWYEDHRTEIVDDGKSAD